MREGGRTHIYLVDGNVARSAILRYSSTWYSSTAVTAVVLSVRRSGAIRHTAGIAAARF